MKPIGRFQFNFHDFPVLRQHFVHCSTNAFKLQNVRFESEQAVNAHLVGISVLVSSQTVRELVHLGVVAGNLLTVLGLNIISQGIAKFT